MPTSFFYIKKISDKEKTIIKSKQVYKSILLSSWVIATVFTKKTQVTFESAIQ